MDYQTLFKRPFEFIAERLGPVDVPVIYFDGTPEMPEIGSCVKFRNITLVSNKPLNGYILKEGIYVKEGSDEIIGWYDHASLSIRAKNCMGYFATCNYPRTYIEKMFEQYLLGVDGRYCFILSDNTAEKLGFNSSSNSEDSSIVHEMTHAWVDDKGL